MLAILNKTKIHFRSNNKPNIQLVLKNQVEEKNLTKVSFEGYIIFLNPFLHIYFFGSKSAAAIQNCKAFLIPSKFLSYIL